MMKVSNTTIKYAKQQFYSKIVDRAVYSLRKFKCYLWRVYIWQ